MTPYSAATQLLAAATAALVDASLAVPARAFVTAEPSPARDCPALSVRWVALQPQAKGTLASGPQSTDRQCILVPLLELEVELVRCLPEVAVSGPQGAPPTAVALDAAALAVSADEVALWRGLGGAWRAGTLLTAVPGEMPCGQVRVGPMTRAWEGGIVALGWHCVAFVGVPFS